MNWRYWIWLQSTISTLRTQVFLICALLFVWNVALRNHVHYWSFVKLSHSRTFELSLILLLIQFLLILHSLNLSTPAIWFFTILKLSSIFLSWCRRCLLRLDVGQIICFFECSCRQRITCRMDQKLVFQTVIWCIELRLSLIWWIQLLMSLNIFVEKYSSSTTLCMKLSFFWDRRNYRWYDFIN